METDIKLYEKENELYPEIMKESVVVFRDLIEMPFSDGIFAGTIVKNETSFPSLIENPKKVLLEAIRIYTMNAMYKAQEYQADFYENWIDHSQWARDVYPNEGWLSAPLTHTQEQKLKKANRSVCLSLLHTVLETRLWRDKIANDTLHIKWSEKSLESFYNLWDFGKHEPALEDFVKKALTGLCETLRNEKRGYLAIYYNTEQEAHTLFELPLSQIERLVLS